RPARPSGDRADPAVGGCPPPRHRRLCLPGCPSLRPSIAPLPAPGDRLSRRRSRRSFLCRCWTGPARLELPRKRESTRLRGQVPRPEQPFLRLPASIADSATLPAERSRYQPPDALSYPAPESLRAFHAASRDDDPLSQNQGPQKAGDEALSLPHRYRFCHRALLREAAQVAECP